MTVLRYTGLFMPPRGQQPGPPAPKVPQLIRSAGAGASSDHATTTEVTLDTTGANVLLVVTNTINTPSPTIGDTRGNSWQTVATAGSTVPAQIRLWTCPRPAHVGPEHRFVVTASFPGIIVFAFHFDNLAGETLSATNSGGGLSIAAPAVGTLEIPFAPALVLAAYGDNSWITSPITPPANFVGLVSINIAPFRNGNLIAGYKIQTEPGTERPVWLVTTSDTLQCLVAAFEG